MTKAEKIMVNNKRDFRRSHSQFEILKQFMIGKMDRVKEKIDNMKITFEKRENSKKKKNYYY